MIPKQKIFRLKTTNRMALPFPWESKAAPQPWPQSHVRVVIPYTPAEIAKAKNGKRAHVQIVRHDKLVEVNYGTFKLR